MSQKSQDINVGIERDPANSDRYQAVITDTSSQRAWTGDGNTAGEACTEATRKFLGDRRSREYVGLGCDS